jgi:hypothetical protein
MKQFEYDYSSDVTEREIKERTEPFRLHTWSRSFSIGEPSPFTIHPAIGWEGIKEALMKHYGNRAEIWPVWKYEHGGIALSLSGERSWDKCQVGYLVLPHAEALRIHGRKRMSTQFRQGLMEEIMQERFDHIRTWEDWVNGKMYDLFEKGSTEPVEYAITEASLEALYPTATWREQ